MRKLVVGGIVLLLCTSVWGTQDLTKNAAAPQGEIRIVDKYPRNWVWVTLNVMEHLVELDRNGELVPRLATGWRWLDDRTLEMHLRSGVTFHNGEVFDADIVKLNWEENTRLQQPHILGNVLNFKPGSRLAVLNIDKLSKMQDRAIQEIDIPSDETDVRTSLIVGHAGGVDDAGAGDESVYLAEVVFDQCSWAFWRACCCALRRW